MYVKDFPKLSEISVRGWVVKYRCQVEKTPPNDIKIGEKRSRPLFLPVELGLQTTILPLRMRQADGNINRHVYGVLMGLIKVVGGLKMEMVKNA